MPKQDTYRERVKHAFNFRKNTVEALARTAGVTLLASIAFTALNDEPSTKKYPLGPITTLGDKAPEYKEIKQLSPTHISLGKTANLNALDLNEPTLLSQNYAANFKAGRLSELQKENLDEVVDSIDTITNSDSSLKVTIDIRGFASDESQVDGRNGDANLGVASAKNLTLAKQRAEVARAYLMQHLEDSDQVTAITSGKENVLSVSQITNIDEIAADYSLTRQELLRKYNSDEELRLTNDEDSELESLLDRSTEIKVTVAQESHTPAAMYESIQTESNQQQSEESASVVIATPGRRGVDIYPIILPPLPRFRKLRNLISLKRQSKKSMSSYGYGYGQKMGYFEKFWHRPLSSLLPAKTIKADYEKLPYRAKMLRRRAPDIASSLNPLNYRIRRKRPYLAVDAEWYDFLLPNRYGIKRK